MNNAVLVRHDDEHVNAIVSNATIVGGNDSSDGADSVLYQGDNLFFFGNGGGDTITGDVSSGETLVAGHGGDSLYFPSSFTSTTLIFGNEGNDTVFQAASRRLCSAGSATIRSPLG
jgi:hypothetical protein